MEHKDIKKLQETAYSLDRIAKAIGTIENSQRLYAISEYSVENRFNCEDAIIIPACLHEEFRQKLMSYLKGRFNECVEKLKSIE